MGSFMRGEVGLSSEGKSPKGGKVQMSSTGMTETGNEEGREN